LSADKYRFPELIEYTIDCEGGVYGYHPPTEVEDWFKRCIEDRPRVTLSNQTDPRRVNHRIVPSHECWMKWFEKWFGQFRDKGDI